MRATTRRPRRSPLDRWRRRAIVGLLLLVGAGPAWRAFGDLVDPAPAFDPTIPTVSAHVDGDTIDVMLGGHTERVRLLGIDTPETKDRGRPVECFGPQASSYTARLLPVGTQVTLERDVVERDHFGRLLAHVHRRVDALHVNLEIVRSGHADVLTIAPNHRHSSSMADARDRARREGRGLWSACSGGTGPE